MAAWCYGLAGTGYAAFALYLGFGWRGGMRGLALALAVGLTALWAFVDLAFALTQATPLFEVGAMAAQVGHCVDRRRSPDDLAPRAFDATPAQCGFGFGRIHPVVHPTQKHPRPAERYVNPGVAIPSAGFEQKHTDICILGEPVCQRTARRSGADDDIVVRHWHVPASRLKCCYPASNPANAFGAA